MERYTLPVFPLVAAQAGELSPMTSGAAGGKARPDRGVAGGRVKNELTRIDAWG